MHQRKIVSAQEQCCGAIIKFQHGGHTGALGERARHRRALRQRCCSHGKAVRPDARWRPASWREAPLNRARGVAAADRVADKRKATRMLCAGKFGERPPGELQAVIHHHTLTRGIAEAAAFAASRSLPHAFAELADRAEAR